MLYNVDNSRLSAMRRKAEMKTVSRRLPPLMEHGTGKGDEAQCCYKNNKKLLHRMRYKTIIGFGFSKLKCQN